jgi:hypothetical protein
VIHDPDDELMGVPLVHALQAPPLPGELAGEDDALAAFRRAVPSRRRRRTVRLATGASVLAVAMAATGGVAAAYPRTLPEPVQNAIHSFLGPIGVPAGPRAAAREAAARHKLRAAIREHRLAAGAKPSPRGPRADVPSPAPATPPAIAPAPAPQSPPQATPGAGSPSPSASASPSAQPTLTVQASRRVVPVHQGLQLRGVLARDGHPIGGRTVYAAVYDVGASSWRQVSQGQTASDGTITLRVAALVRNCRVRLATKGMTSRAIAITVIPRLTATLTRTSPGDRYLVDVSADGGEPGDAAVLQRYDGGSWVRVASHRLGNQSRTRFTIPVPADPTRYRVRLAGTKTHGPAGVPFTAQP